MQERRDATTGTGKAVRDSDLLREVEAVKSKLKREFALKKILGKSRTVLDLHRQIEQIASCTVNVLVSGESGTGKELVARAIHYLSPRAGKPFIPVNCGAIPENLFENELFGHVKGAFTDASFAQTGLVKEADRGTLFLDEIGTVQPYIQIKLLRLLQDNEYTPLGESRFRKADIRIIAATNRDLRSLVEEGVFREDLFYRLNIVSIHLPPLRERREDIPLLADHFLKQYSEKYGKATRRFSDDALDFLTSCSWSGNIRELENKVQQCIVLSTSPVIAKDELHLPTGEAKLHTDEMQCLKVAKKQAIDAFEREYLIRLLTEHNGNVVTAAKMSGKSRTALWNILKKHHLSPKQFRS